MSSATFVLPPKSQVGYLDPSIAGEGMKIIGEDGETMSWTPPPEKLVMPDLSTVKSLRKYFGRGNFPAWPAWLYHPTEAPRLLKNGEDAAELGICYRPATPDEQMRYGKRMVWDWKDDCQWRHQPYPANNKRPTAEYGKEVVPIKKPDGVAQDELIERLLPAVVAAVLQAQGGSKAPARVSEDDWKEFKAFQAWKMSAKTVDEFVEEAAKPVQNALDPPANASELTRQGTTEAEERSLWIEEADARGIVIDKRWSLARIKEAVEKAA